MKKNSIFVSVAMLIALTFSAFGCDKQMPQIEGEIAYELKPYTDVVIPDEEGMIALTDEYARSPFSTDKDDNIVYTLNALFHKFTAVDDGTNAVHLMGNEPTWFEWNALKMIWYNDPSYHAMLKEKIVSFPQTEDGYMWSWGDRPFWPDGASSLHYDGTLRYINAVYLICAWEANTSFLEMEDDTSQEINLANLDNGNPVDEYFKTDEALTYYADHSRGRTVWEKTQKCMDYLENVLGGSTGLLKIDNGRNTGRYESCSSTYWDNYPTGYYDAYVNLIFPMALESYAGLWEMKGDFAKAEEYRDKADAARDAYDKKFWNEKTGRYVSTIDADGQIRDFGLSFLNTEALYAGIGNETRAAYIYSWMNGTRIVEGDRAQGDDIYSTKIAPVVNTVAIEDKPISDENEVRHYWWNGIKDGINPLTNSKWGEHQTNGSTIFYTSYYDLMSRIRYISAESAMNRLSAIASEYEVDQLMRDPVNKYGSEWKIGIIGEFPESGLVPTVFVYGFLGLTAKADRLSVSPSVPDDYTIISCESIRYGGNVYSLSVKKEDKITLGFDGGVDIKFEVSDFAGREGYTAKIYSSDGTLMKSVSGVEQESGTFLFDLSDSGAEAGSVIIS